MKGLKPAAMNVYRLHHQWNKFPGPARLRDLSLQIVGALGWQRCLDEVRRWLVQSTTPFFGCIPQDGSWEERVDEQHDALDAFEPDQSHFPPTPLQEDQDELDSMRVRWTRGSGRRFGSHNASVVFPILQKI
eukprot:5226706-Amphidinium_carterae.1